MSLKEFAIFETFNGLSDKEQIQVLTKLFSISRLSNLTKAIENAHCNYIEQWLWYLKTFDENSDISKPKKYLVKCWTFNELYDNPANCVDLVRTTLFISEKNNIHPVCEDILPKNMFWIPHNQLS